ncbi:hypothetical protein SAMN04488564_110329 [Lentzea waywayandensis]|uniref:Uncharacterized protein n=1 Tax=Lentzea waywayandensis TaxID=84724 RepID=A0A1I6FB08_9PSEU|nr:hypothetical protein [Lentzea waywayandensis]SFR27118.1 hypothetical protein SAMN04488564_110329 [Lentzea waywayandensis]
MRFVLLLVLFAAGCGASAAEPAGYPDEVRSLYSAMKWPSDVRPDLEALIKATAPAQGEQGFARQALAVANTCAWYRSWDAAVTRGDKAQAATALDAIEHLVTRYPPEADTAGRQFVRDAAAKASSGDPALVRDYVDANCFDTRWA